MPDRPIDPDPPLPQAKQKARGGSHSMVLMSGTSSISFARTWLAILNSAPDEAAAADFIPMDLVEAVANAAEIEARAAIRQAGPEAGKEALAKVYLATDFDLDPSQQVKWDLWAAIIGRLPPDLLDRATAILCRGGYRYGHRPPKPQDWFDVIRDAWEVRRKPLQEVQDLKRRVQARRERLARFREDEPTAEQREAESRRYLTSLLERPETDDREDLPEALRHPDTAELVRQTWRAAGRYPDPADRWPVRNAILWEELRRRGVPPEVREQSVRPTPQHRRRPSYGIGPAGGPLPRRVWVQPGWDKLHNEKEPGGVSDSYSEPDPHQSGFDPRSVPISTSDRACDANSPLSQSPESQAFTEPLKAAWSKTRRHLNDARARAMAFSGITRVPGDLPCVLP